MASSRSNGWSDDIVRFLLNQITDKKYLISWAAENGILSDTAVVRRLQELEGQKVC